MEALNEMDQVQIADDVIAVIAEIAVSEVEGIVGTTSGKGDIKKAFSTKKGPKGIKVVVDDGEVQLDLGIIVKYGTRVQKLAREAQEKVKSSVETMTGLPVRYVNVHVVGVFFDKNVLA